jgi:uncharacterized protein
MEYELRTHDSLASLGEANFRALERPDTPPFSSFDWLDALERTGCVTPERGWMPFHLTLHRAGKLVACAPAYVKGNSEGEFVFDHAWARFCEGSLGVSYYPKLVFAVPFTPATGPRLLIQPDESPSVVLPVFAAAVRKLTEELNVSGSHVLFPSESETEALVAAGLARRVGVQFHWRNPGYTSFDDFLSRFSAKRRHQIRRERREVEAQGIELCVHTGSDLNVELADFIYTFYRSTVDKHVWGRRYLKRQFFEEVLSRLRDRLHVVIAYDRASGRKIAGAFNLLGSDALYGRYWGALEDRPFLHFEVCFYRGIEDAIARKLSRFEPGAGGEHKVARGFEPSLTYSAHHLADERLDRAVRDYLKREDAAVRDEVATACADMSMKPFDART